MSPGLLFANGVSLVWFSALALESLGASRPSPVLLCWRWSARVLDAATVRVGELAVGKPAARRNIRSIESAEISESDVNDAINGLARLERNSRFELTESWNQDNNWGQNKVSTDHWPPRSMYLLKVSLL